ncbi:MAG: Ig-like domain-containing protein [Gammaproteobacteria bacterium]|nr:Ig-like domain-containing protein [Gammaproteobacteria bacterium]
MKYQNRLHAGLLTAAKPALSLLAAFILLSLTACGGGGGGGGDTANSAPIAETLSITTAEDTPISMSLGSDPESNPLSYTTSGPANGSLSGTAPNITYTPNPNFYGKDSFTFTLNDGALDSEQATVTIDVTPVNDLTTFQAASVVIGQANFTDNKGGTGPNTSSSSYGNPGVANGILYLPDTSNHRLLGFNSIPTTNNADADFALGQTDFTTKSSGTTALKFNRPQTVAFGDGKMFLSDVNNHRILIWNSIPASDNVAADVVLGQDDFSTGAAGPCGNTGLSEPQAVWSVNGKLILGDSGHHRVLIWNSIPETNNVPADIVLGQDSFTNCTANDDDQKSTAGDISARTFNFPSGVWSDGTRLVMLDSANHRVLIWNSFPTANFTPADVVLGQKDFTHNTRNDEDQDGTPDMVDTDEVASARTLKDPYYGVYSNGHQLFVADSGNHRVLIWNSFPTANFTPADVVLGQGDFTHNARNDLDQDDTNDGQASAQTLSFPSGIFQSGNQLIITDPTNHRYLIFNE